MGTDTAKPIDKERAATAECVNAIARNHGLRRDLGRRRSPMIPHEMPHAPRLGGDADRAAGVGSAPLRRAGALLRCAAPTPAKGTFLFGERRGHFYRWTTPDSKPVPEGNDVWYTLGSLDITYIVQLRRTYHGLVPWRKSHFN